MIMLYLLLLQVETRLSPVLFTGTPQVWADSTGFWIRVSSVAHQWDSDGVLVFSVELERPRP